MQPEVPDMILPRKIPEYFVDHCLEVYFLGRQQWIPLAEVNRVVLGKAGESVDAGPVFLAYAVGQHTLDQVEIFAHGRLVLGDGVETCRTKLHSAELKCNQLI
jgi:hypothetical protein